MAESKLDQIEYSFGSTASFDVDCQQGFTPICPNELSVPDGASIVEALNVQASKARYRVGSKDCHPANAHWITTDASKIATLIPANNNPNIDVYWPAHCTVGTKGNELLPGLPKPIAYDFFVYKGIEPDLHPYGACYHDIQESQSTGVIEWLKMKMVKTVLVGGLATDYCVKTTAIQLRKAGFDVIVNSKACRGIAENTIAEALTEMLSLGIMVM